MPEATGTSTSWLLSRRRLLLRSAALLGVGVALAGCKNISVVIPTNEREGGNGDNGGGGGGGGDGSGGGGGGGGESSGGM